MECNRDEALRAKALAEQKLKSQDYEGGKKLLMRAKRLFPELDIHQMMAVADVHIKAQVKVGAEIDWYGILEVAETAEEGLIKKQYRKLALALHPDKNNFAGAESAFKFVSEAFSVLNDKTKRLQHDFNRKRLFACSQPLPPQPRPPACRTTAPPAQSYPLTFWTTCPACQMRFQYDRRFLNFVLNCKECRRPFHAAEKPMPSVPQQNGFAQPRSQGAAGVGVGVGVGVGTRWRQTQFSSAVPNPTQQFQQAPPDGTSEYVKNMFQKAKTARQHQKTVDEFLRAAKTGKSAPENNEQKKEEASKEEREKKQEQVAPNNVSGDRRDKGKSKRPREEQEKETDSVKCEQQQGTNGESSEVPSKRRKESKDDDSQEKVSMRRSSRRKNVIHYNFDERLKQQLDNDLEEFPTRKRQTGTTSQDTSGSEANAEVPELREHDFDATRSISQIKKSQFWAVYDELDGMPRWYCRVEKVNGENNIKIKWLEAINYPEDQQSWLDTGHYLSTGRFRLMSTSQSLPAATFCRRVHPKPVGKSTWTIYPQSGEVWAVFNDWEQGWLTEDANSRKYAYTAVEVLTDYSPSEGVRFARLMRYQKTVFARVSLDSESDETCSSSDMLMFSHQIPAVYLGDKPSLEPPKCWKLDAEATEKIE